MHARRRKFGEEDLRDFVGRIIRNGGPDTRYQVIGQVTHPYDLQKLDAASFMLRRLCWPGLPGMDIDSEIAAKMIEDARVTCIRDWPTIPFPDGHFRSKLDALREDNVMYFPELAASSRDRFHASSDCDPAELLTLTGQFGDDDIEWIQSRMRYPRGKAKPGGSSLE